MSITGQTGRKSESEAISIFDVNTEDELLGNLSASRLNSVKKLVG